MLFNSVLETCHVPDSGSQSQDVTGPSGACDLRLRELCETGRVTRGPLCPFKSVLHEKALPCYLAS